MNQQSRKPAQARSRLHRRVLASYVALSAAVVSNFFKSALRLAIDASIRARKSGVPGSMVMFASRDALMMALALAV